MARPPEPSRNANTNDSEVRPKVRKVKKNEGSAASRGVDLARTAPVYSPLAVPLAGAASASTSTDSLQQPSSALRSQSASPFAANEPRHHSEITLPKGEEVSKKRSREGAGDKKGKKKEVPTYTTIAGSHRREIANAVRNAGLTGTPAAPVSVIIPSKAPTNTRARSDSNLLAIPGGNVTVPAMQDRSGGSASQDLSRTISANTAASASTSSLAGTVASTSSRPRADTDSQKSVQKKKKKKKEPASHLPASQPISGAAGVSVTVLSPQAQPRTSGTRSRPPTSRPAITAETQLRTQRSVAPSNASIRSHSTSVDELVGPAPLEQSDVSSERSVLASNLPSQARSFAETGQQTASLHVPSTAGDQGEPAPPPWSAPLSTITLAFTPMHAYLADLDPEPSSPSSPTTLRLAEPRASPSPAVSQHPPVPDSPPPAFRSRTPSPTPEEQIEWPDIDAEGIDLYERGYNSSETSLDLMNDQGKARVASDGKDSSDVSKARYWDARQWEAWRRAGIQLEERLRRMEAKGKYKAVEQASASAHSAPTAALPMHESSLLPLAEQAASAGSSMTLPQMPLVQAESPLPTPAPPSKEVQQSPLGVASPTPLQQRSSSPAQLTARLQDKLAQGTSRFPSIGSVRRARLKRFEEQRKDSKNLTSIIEGDTRTAASQPLPEISRIDSSPNPESVAQAKSPAGTEEVTVRRESITSGLDRLEALLRRGSKRSSATNDPTSHSAVTPSTAPQSVSLREAVDSSILSANVDNYKSDLRPGEELASVFDNPRSPLIGKKQEESILASSDGPDASTSFAKPIQKAPATPESPATTANKRTSGIAQILSNQIEARRKDSPGPRAVDVPHTSDAILTPSNGSRVEAVESESPGRNLNAGRSGHDSGGERQVAEQIALDEVAAKKSISELVQPDRQHQYGTGESSIEAGAAIDAIAHLKAIQDEEARIQKQVAEDARLAAELQSLMLRSATIAQPVPTVKIMEAPAEETASVPKPLDEVPFASRRKSSPAKAASAAQRRSATRNSTVTKAIPIDANLLPVLTLPRAPPRVTTDPLSADNLRRLSRATPKPLSLHSAQSASSSSSNEGDLSLSPIASDSSDSDSADGESTARPPASSLLSYTAGSLPPSVTGGARFDNNTQREAAAASWRRSEDGRRHSAILSRPLSIKRKPPPVPPKRWAGVWDQESVREVLTQGQKAIRQVVEGATEASRALRAGSSRLSGVQEEDGIWETVGREDNLNSIASSDPAWTVVGREIAESPSVPASPPKPRRLPPPPPLLEEVHSSDDSESAYSRLQNHPTYPTPGQHTLPISNPSQWAENIRHEHKSIEHRSPAFGTGQLSYNSETPAFLGESKPLPPSSLQRSSATRRPLSFQGRPSSRRGSLENPQGPPDSPSASPSGVTRANLNARPRHVYSSSVPSASLSTPTSPHALPLRPRRPLPRPPIAEESLDTSPVASRRYGLEYDSYGLSHARPSPGVPLQPANSHGLIAEDTHALPPSARNSGPTRPATTEEIDSLPVGRVELERKRTDRSGKIKQKLSCVGINCNRCDICLLQFKEDELACVLPLCLHVFHAEPCTRSYLSANHQCPTCSTPLM